MKKSRLDYAHSILKFDWRQYIPKSVICFQEGYNRQTLIGDLIAGVTVGVISLPLAMAFAIGSGLSPSVGLFTAIIAGFLISALGGSRVQIGGPTGAFIVIVYGVVQRHGYEGLAVATIMAGFILILMGLARFGSLLKFIPFPVIIGFTSGIAVVLFSAQIRDIFGLDIATVPVGFVEKWRVYILQFKTLSLPTFLIGLSSLAIIIFLRRYFPRIPGAIVAVALGGLIVWGFDLPVPTVESHFGEVPNSLPSPTFPSFSFEKVRQLMPDAITIALLAGIESLLSAIVADGMSGNRHKSNCELVAQGFANIGSIVFGGIPATGAIARTATNIRMGAKTPVAGMTHAITVFILVALFAPFAGKIPLAGLAAVLIMVAWQMSELHHFREILRGSFSDIAVLLITFSLVILIDLTVAIEVGIVLAALLFMRRMTETTSVNITHQLVAEDPDRQESHDREAIYKKEVPEGVEIFEINGPLFFGVSDLVAEAFNRLSSRPKVFILRLHKVPVIDASGMRALDQLGEKCKERGILFILSGVGERFEEKFQRGSLFESIGHQNIVRTIDLALQRAHEHLGKAE